jgi:hypothetical protein
MIPGLGALCCVALADNADVAGVLAGYLLDREFGGRYDGAQRCIVAGGFGPFDLKGARLLMRPQRYVRVLLEAQPRRLQDGGCGGTDDILTSIGGIGVAARMNTGQPISAVPVEGYLEHARGALWARAG